MQELRARQIPFQFKDVNNQAVVDELFALGAQNHIDASCCRVPLVGIEDKLLVNSNGVRIEQVLTALQKHLQSSTELSSSNKISDGQYWNGDLDGVLEVSANKYRYIDPGQPSPWHPISNLRRITQEIIHALHPNGLGYPYPGYWCSKKAPGWVEWNQRNNQLLYCTNKGWSFKRTGQ